MAAKHGQTTAEMRRQYWWALLDAAVSKMVEVIREHI
jgi:hypothetical protein